MSGYNQMWKLVSVSQFDLEAFAQALPPNQLESFPTLSSKKQLHYQ